MYNPPLTVGIPQGGAPAHVNQARNVAAAVSLAGIGARLAGANNWIQNLAAGYAAARGAGNFGAIPFSGRQGIYAGRAVNAVEAALASTLIRGGLRYGWKGASSAAGWGYRRLFGQKAKARYNSQDGYYTPSYNPGFSHKGFKRFKGSKRRYRKPFRRSFQRRRFRRFRY